MLLLIGQLYFHEMSDVGEVQNVTQQAVKKNSLNSAEQEKQEGVWCYVTMAQFLAEEC